MCVFIADPDAELYDEDKDSPEKDGAVATRELPLDSFSTL